ncbi:uncharacterized protein LOC134814308 [Bolinopsis microptera]|uniref:uncharacterized protein LOC134814308 n=1 Tax=Bolinopsis microptera TaxID=2820187 RepID=UPI003078E141
MIPGIIDSGSVTSVQFVFKLESVGVWIVRMSNSSIGEMFGTVAMVTAQGGMSRQTWRWLGIALLFLIGSSVLINASLVSLFCIKGRYKKSYHQAYINLACSDLAFSLWGVAFTAPNYFFGRDEGVMCTAIPLIGSYLFTVNLSSVLPIAVDRLVAVYSPMR